jgi:hypothetical protein
VYGASAPTTLGIDSPAFHGKAPAKQPLLDSFAAIRNTSSQRPYPTKNPITVERAPALDFHGGEIISLRDGSIKHSNGCQVGIEQRQVCT